MTGTEPGTADPFSAENEPQIRRVVVALDATEQSVHLLEAAAELAQSMESELVGIFVEDINLLRLVELPFAYELGSFSTARRPLQTLTLERQLRAQAATLRRMLMRVAEQHKLPWSFQVVRGVIATEVNKATSESDLVILGRSRRTRTGATPLGSTTRAVVVQAPPRLTLVLQRHIPRKQPVLVGYDGSSAAKRALSLATQLLREQAAPLILILISDEVGRADALRQEVTNWLRLHGIEARYHWLERANIERLVNLVLMEQGGAFVLPSEGLNLHDAALLTILDLMQCPVLLVR
ncbi:MAG: universal stress protein [Caldilineaceae bacterium]